MRIEAGFFGVASIAFLTPARQRDDDHAFAPCMTADAAAGINPTEFGEPDIQKHDIRPQMVGCLDCGETVVHDERAMSAELQKCRDRLRAVAIVIDDKDAACGGVERTRRRRGLEIRM